MGMTAHIVFPEAGPTPATQNPTMINLIREDIGFGGLLMTDDISMEALDGSVAERGRRALDAGCDIVLHCNGDLTEMRAIAECAGRLTRVAQARADAVIAARKPADDVDIFQLEAEFAAYLA